MPNAGEIGVTLYKEIWEERNADFGAAVVGIIGGQGSVKTSACLDIVEKKLRNHPDEKIFWHETVGSPMQCNRLLNYKPVIFVEEGLELEFIDVTHKKIINPKIMRFKGFEELYKKSKHKALNVVFFDYKKKWVNLMRFLESDINAGGDWQTVVFDELESIFPAEVNNQTQDRWWDWVTTDATECLKEMRKSRVGFIGNYHNKNSIYHSIRNKFMYRLYGFGARQEGRVQQRAIDQLVRGEFWIEKQFSVFGKIKLKHYYPESREVWTTKII